MLLSELSFDEIELLIYFNIALKECVSEDLKKTIEKRIEYLKGLIN